MASPRSWPTSTSPPTTETPRRTDLSPSGERRARLTRDEHQLGEWEHARRSPDAPLRPNVFPALRYRDADAAVAFLTRAFGAHEKAADRGEDGVIHHAELALGDGLVMLGQYSEDGWLGGEPPRPLSSTVSIYVVIGDPDAHHAAAVAAGATIVRPLQDTDYGSREYSARDCEGNLWSFGTYDPYVT